MAKRCSERSHLNITHLVRLETLQLSRMIITETRLRPECEGLSVCRAVKRIASHFLRDVINVALLEEGHNPFVSMLNCQYLFPHCI